MQVMEQQRLAPDERQASNSECMLALNKSFFDYEEIHFADLVLLFSFLTGHICTTHQVHTRRQSAAFQYGLNNASAFLL